MSKKSSKSRPWTADEENLVRAGRTACPPIGFMELGRQLGRKYGCVHRKWQRLQELATGGRATRRHEEPMHVMEIPPEVWAERDHRINLPQPLFGDPLPGYSALDRRQEGRA